MLSSIVISTWLSLSAVSTSGEPDRTFSGPERSIPVGFGRSLAVEGTTVVLGTSARESGRGAFADFAAYVFDTRRSAGSPQRLSLADAHPQSRFGCNVALRGGVLAVGVCPEKARDPAVVLFSQRGGVWGETARIHSRDGRRLGQGLAVTADEVLASDGNVVDVFDQADGGLRGVQRLSGEDVQRKRSVDSFGSYLATDGETLVVGMTEVFRLQRRLEASAPGAAIYDRRQGEWRLAEVLRPMDVYTRNNTRVAIDGPWIAIAAQTIEDRRPTVRGMVFLYRRDNGHSRLAQTLDGEGHPNWAASVALRGDGLLVGDPTAGRVTLHRLGGPKARLAHEWSGAAGRFVQFGGDVAWLGDAALVTGPSVISLFVTPP